MKARELPNARTCGLPRRIGHALLGQPRPLDKPLSENFGAPRLC